MALIFQYRLFSEDKSRRFMICWVMVELPGCPFADF